LFVVLSLFVVVIKQKSIRVQMITLILILFLILFLILARVTPPCSYRQPDGNGQLVSRRYCIWKRQDILKGGKKKSFFRHVSLLARREYDTKARSHALTRATRKKKDDVSPQGLEPWSTGVITFT
jgi:hypothetical protein